MQNFECCWKFSIFGRNSWILKVLAHENSVECQKKIKSFIFKVWWRGLLFKLSQYDRRAKFWVLLEIFNFWSKFLNFKGVAHENSVESQKKIKIFHFQGMMKGPIIYTFAVWVLCKILRVVGNFEFLVELHKF